MIFIVTVLIIIIMFAIALLFANRSYNAMLNRSTLKNNAVVPVDQLNWLDSCEPEDVWLINEQSMKLHALLKENHPNRWIVICHGYTKTARNMSLFAQNFYQLGYSILLPEARGHGLSEGDYVGMGWHERLDILEWINYLNQEYSGPQIGLFGVSMGAETVLNLSGEHLPPNIMAIIEDCGYSSIRNELAYEIKHLYHLPVFPLLQLLSLITKWRAGYNPLTEGSALEQVAKSQTPILFIHGEADKIVPFYMLQELYNAAACEKQLLAVPHAQHANSCKTDPELYWQTVEDFLDRYFVDAEEDLYDEYEEITDKN